MNNLPRREFLKALGATTATKAVGRQTLSSSLAPERSTTARNIVKKYGLLECSDSKLLEALSRSRADILGCTINDQTHCPDVGHKWGFITVLNDLWFGMRGGLYVGGKEQHKTFMREMRKIAKHVHVFPGQPPVPFAVSWDGSIAQFNPDPGMDLDRCAEFILEVVKVYEATGDREFASDLYPKCVEVINYLSKQDHDGDFLLEGRVHPWNPISRTPGGSPSSTYIGDGVGNTWKDFGASLFFYMALRHLALLERILGKESEASSHLKHAEQVGAAARRILWNDATDGFLAWVEADGTAHSDWITGNNLQAVVSGLADSTQSVRILEKLDRHRHELEELIPCRVRIGIYAPGLAADPPNDYWNGGIWTLVSAPDMLARVKMNDMAGALRVAQLLSTHPVTTEWGFYENYSGNLGIPDHGGVPGLLMNNGGVLWGFFEGILGIASHGDQLRFRASVPHSLVPAKARIYWRSADVEIHWKSGRVSSATLNGKTINSENGYYTLNLTPEPGQTLQLEIVQSKV